MNLGYNYKSAGKIIFAQIYSKVNEDNNNKLFKLNDAQ